MKIMTKMTDVKSHISKRGACLALAALASATLTAQVPGSALDYMLQRPRVSKVYQHKRPFDHLFVDAGAGLNGMGTSSLRLGAQGSFGLGDWITPEHGVRLNVDGGLWKVFGKKVKFADLSLDYLLNITALSQPGTYYTPRRFELIGVAGASYAWSRHQGRWQNGFGLHIGLRGQVSLSHFTYAYMEPRIGLVEDQVSQVNTWHGYRPYGQVMLGLGYRLPESRLQNRYDGRGFADGLFFSLMGGPAFLANSHPTTWDDRFGGRAAVSVGKWFDAYNALRLTANASSIHQYASTNNTKAVGLQLDYMANLHNLFGGLNPNRKFWMDLVAGVSYNRTADQDHVKHNMFGLGGGLQANIRLARGLALSLEPRVDIYGQHYAPHTSSFDKRDVTASFLAGLTYTYNDRRAAQVKDVDDIHRSAITVVGGVANRLNAMSEGKMYAPVGRVSFTRWYAPAFAWRANVQGLIRGKRATGYNYVQAVAGLDWMTDLTALSCGYDRSRTLSFKTLAGFNLGLDYAKHGKHTTYFSPDIHAGGQVAVRVAEGLHVVAEPQVAYELSRRLKPSHVGRFVPSLAVGLEYSLQRSGKAGQPVDKPAKPHFVSASIGTGLYTGNFAEMHPRNNKFSFVGEVAYGQWLNGVSGVHAALSNTTVQRARGKGNQNITSLSAGYMMNIKSAITGERTDEDRFHLTGIADLSLVGSNRKGKDMKVTLGGKLALQAGVAVSKSVEVYVEPAAVIYGKGVEFNVMKHHPLEGEARLSLGTKWNF
ncbi:MAG TPA: hypothetical protein DD401_01460 [Prevotella sp.]|nr:hypothetical protein [Prevotella sp.]